MAEHYEDRHRELREADADERAAWLAGSADAEDVIAAARPLDWFEARTGPLVDELVAAVREMSQYEDRYENCRNIDWEAYDRAVAKLAALDEASGQ